MVTYDQLLKRKSPYRATHVFTDLDRLPNWRLHEAALLYRKVKRAGLRTLNDPARFLGRFGLLRGLHRVQINDFNAYRADDFATPSRWPVFLRLEGDHAAPVSGLLEDEHALDNALKRAIDDGAPRSALLIIEYAAEPVQPGVYRKLSAFRIADRVLGYTCVHDDNWLVKYGALGIATPEMYEEEYSFVAENPHAAAVSKAFDLAGIDYGRADFGLVGGKPQIYEINSNPHVDLTPQPALSARRNESIALFRTKYIDAMEEIDVSPRARWRVKSSVITRRARALPLRALGALARLTKGPKAAASAHA